MALRDPAHRAAHDRMAAAEKFGAAVHQLLEPDVAFRRMDGARLGDQAFTTHAACSASSPKALCSTRTANSSWSSAIRALTFISLLETASRLIWRSASTSNI